jgi:predicted Rossmann-fold nucleotide-binding protein
MKLIRLGDGYVALPGGTGTLVELALAWEMIHKQLLSKKPLVALGRSWRLIISEVEQADSNCCGLVCVADTAAAAVEILQAAPIPRKSPN